MRSLGWALIQYEWCSYKKGKFGPRNRQAYKGECHVNMKMEIGIKHPKPRNIKDGQQTTMSYKRHGTDSPSQSSEETDTANTWILNF